VTNSHTHYSGNLIGYLPSIRCCTDVSLYLISIGVVVVILMMLSGKVVRSLVDNYYDNLKL